MKLQLTKLVWLPPTGKKYHRVGKAGSWYYSLCGRMLPKGPDIDIDIIWPHMGDIRCKKCKAVLKKIKAEDASK